MADPLAAQANDYIRYEPDERPPLLVAAGVGAQAAMVTVPSVVLAVVIVARIAEQSDSYLSWAVFAAMLVSGVTTIVQAVRVGRVGAGHVLIMGTSGAFIAVCVAALIEGGPSTMASLVVVSSLFQFAMASRLSLLRRIFTPVVAGVVVMLITATVMPIVFDTLGDVPEDASHAAALATALVTLGAVVGLVLRVRPRGGCGLRCSGSSWVAPPPRCSGSTTCNRWPTQPGSASRSVAGRAST